MMEVQLPNSTLNDVLSSPIDWSKFLTDRGLRRFLEDLQANILKGHGREHTANVFLKFDKSNVAALRSATRSLAAGCTSALKQLKDAQRFKAGLGDGGRVLCFLLTRSGYDALQKPAPADQAFKDGLKARSGALFDTPPIQWDSHLGGGAEVDALLLVADSSASKVAFYLDKLRRYLAGGPIAILGVEIGVAYKHVVGGKREGVENFGYVDGRSQPLFLAEQIASEPKANWDPAFAPKQFIVPDSGGAGAWSAGSYFVFRKLEQNVRGFKSREQDLADALSLAGADRERAGALAVGRFEDGTPTVLSCKENNASPVPNDFNYSADPQGAKCPFRAHIRKSNPRGESVRLGATVADERSHIMARRGITYGSRVQADDGEFLDRPSGGVGLLFMAYMSDIAHQFEFTQSSWVNQPKFVSGFKPGDAITGIDPVIGQRPGPATDAMPWSDQCSGHSTPDTDFAGFVSMRGGDYFFAPSRSFLASL
jgi:Dyp-type peroxidase family